jgi:large subunit ribosomal protein L35
MVKHKTRKSLVNRFKLTKRGKILRRQAFRRHLNAKKSKKKLTNLKKGIEVKGFYAKKLKKAMNIKKPKVYVDKKEVKNAKS